MSALPHDDLGTAWRAARPAPAGVHLNSAACSRQSERVLEAVARHARREAEVGASVAEQEAEGLLQQGRSVLAGLVGMAAADVAFTESASASVRTLFDRWRLPPGTRVGVLPGEYWHNLAVLHDRGLVPVVLPADDLGRADLDGVERVLRDDPPALVHVTLVGSHRGVVQPGRELAALCRAAGVPLVLDVAQALGHVDCDLGADVAYAPARKWLAGPRGVGFLVMRPSITDQLTPVLPPDAVRRRWRGRRPRPLVRVRRRARRRPGRPGGRPRRAPGRRAGPGARPARRARPGHPRAARRPGRLVGRRAAGRADRDHHAAATCRRRRRRRPWPGCSPSTACW